jgi:hypothetical protein
VNRLLKPAIGILSASAISVFADAPHAQDAVGSAPPRFDSGYVYAGPAQCGSSAAANCRRKARDPAPTINEDHGWVRVQGDATAVRLDARRTTVADVLAALNVELGVSYRSSIVLDKDINGIYVGSLRRVLSRVLDGYNYVIRQDDARFAVDILGQRGARAVSVVATVDPFHPLRERKRPRLQN